MFRDRASSCELRPEEAGLVLVDPDPDRARRLHPVVVDVLGTRGPTPITSATLKAIARTWSGSGPLTRYWSGHPTGGPSSSG